MRGAGVSRGHRIKLVRGGTTVIVFALVLMGCSHGNTPSTAAKGSATLQKPVALTVTGGGCESDGKGTVGANFGNALAFNIGPGTVGAKALGMSQARFVGPGTYRKVMISGYPAKGKVFAGLGTVIVNDDRQTGTFATDDGTAAGSWNCGAPLK
jgi:hypothetical protein